jgi:4a-hydroxytetrahydrobiopterin dehydratase
MAEKTDKTYSDQEVEERLEKELPGWYLEDGWIRRKYATGGWPQTMMAVNAIAFLAESAYHHPDLAVTWGKLWVKLKNHAAGGITDKDFALAKKIDEVVLWQPEDDSALEGNPKKFVEAG